MIVVLSRQTVLDKLASRLSQKAKRDEVDEEEETLLEVVFEMAKIPAATLPSQPEGLTELQVNTRGRPWRYSVIPSTPDFQTEYQICRSTVIRPDYQFLPRFGDLILGLRVIPCQLNQFLQKFPGVRLQYCPKNS